MNLGSINDTLQQASPYANALGAMASIYSANKYAEETGSSAKKHMFLALLGSLGVSNVAANVPQFVYHKQNPDLEEGDASIRRTPLGTAEHLGYGLGSFAPALAYHVALNKYNNNKINAKQASLYKEAIGWRQTKRIQDASEKMMESDPDMKENPKSKTDYFLNHLKKIKNHVNSPDYQGRGDQKASAEEMIGHSIHTIGNFSLTGLNSDVLTDAMYRRKMWDSKSDMVENQRKITNRKSRKIYSDTNNIAMSGRHGGRSRGFYGEESDMYNSKNSTVYKGNVREHPDSSNSKMMGFQKPADDTSLWFSHQPQTGGRYASKQMDTVAPKNVYVFNSKFLTQPGVDTSTVGPATAHIAVDPLKTNNFKIENYGSRGDSRPGYERVMSGSNLNNNNLKVVEKFKELPEPDLMYRGNTSFQRVGYNPQNEPNISSARKRLNKALQNKNIMGIF